MNGLPLPAEVKGHLQRVVVMAIGRFNPFLPASKVTVVRNNWKRLGREAKL